MHIDPRVGPRPAPEHLFQGLLARASAVRAFTPSDANGWSIAVEINADPDTAGPFTAWMLHWPDRAACARGTNPTTLVAVDALTDDDEATLDDLGRRMGITASRPIPDAPQISVEWAGATTGLVSGMTADGRFVASGTVGDLALILVRDAVPTGSMTLVAVDDVAGAIARWWDVARPSRRAEPPST